MAFVPARTARANATSIHALNSIQEGTAASLLSASRVRTGVTDLPGREVGSPGPVQGGQAPVAFLQPTPACLPARKARDRSPRPRRDRRCRSRQPGCEKGTIGGLRTRDLRQPCLDRREPCRIGQAGLAMENGRVIRIPPLPGLGLVEQPGHRAPRHPAMIGGIEVGCQVFGVPAQPAAIRCSAPSRPACESGCSSLVPVIPSRCSRDRAAAGRSCHKMTWYCVHPGAGRMKNLALRRVSASEPVGLKRAVIRFSGARARRRSRRTAISSPGSASVIRCRSTRRPSLSVQSSCSSPGAGALGRQRATIGPVGSSAIAGSWISSATAGPPSKSPAARSAAFTVATASPWPEEAARCNWCTAILKVIYDPCPLWQAWLGPFPGCSETRPPFRSLAMLFPSRLAGVALLFLALPAGARTLEVGPGKQFAQPSQAAAAAQDGDRVVIAPGQYFDCAVWRQNNLIIEGVSSQRHRDHGQELSRQGPLRHPRQQRHRAQPDPDPCPRAGRQWRRHPRRRAQPACGAGSLHQQPEWHPGRRSATGRDHRARQRVRAQRHLRAGLRPWHLCRLACPPARRAIDLPRHSRGSSHQIPRRSNRSPGLRHRRRTRPAPRAI